MTRWKNGVQADMSDYIKREDALEQFDYYDLGEYLTTQIRGMLMDVPSADVAPVRHGKYIGTEFDGYADGCPVYYEWKCSECGCVFEEEEPTYNYCPNCGARMDEEVD